MCSPKSQVLSSRLKAEIDSLDLMLEGRSFYNSGAALEKALFPHAF
jgi:hypothetical protein